MAITACIYSIRFTLVSILRQKAASDFTDNDKRFKLGDSAITSDTLREFKCE